MNVTKLPGMNLVYHDTDRDPSSQFIMIFPVGIIGKQMIIYKSYDKYNILDICEVEIWGMYLYKFLDFINILSDTLFSLREGFNENQVIIDGEDF